MLRTCAADSTSVRQRLTLEMRSLAASLGYGWAGVGYKPAALRSGRNERETYTFELCGVGVNRYCEENNLPVLTKSRACVKSAAPNAATTTRLENGYAWVRVRSISDAGLNAVGTIASTSISPAASGRSGGFVT